MLVVITYDVSVTDPQGKRRLRRVSKACVNRGQRVQNSVFECYIDYGAFLMLRDQLLRIIDPQRDSLRFYLLGNHYDTRVEHYGATPGTDLAQDLLLV